jgi:hypothetical protein
MGPPARPTTPGTVDTTRKRTYTLVYRTPDKPQAALVAPRTPFVSITSEHIQVATSPSTLPGEPTGTALARLDRRPRREGKNSVYNEAMAIERGRGRGSRGGRGVARGRGGTT